MSALSANSHDYYYLTQERVKYTRNSKKYYACTQLIKINKLERMIIIEDEAVRRQQDKQDERIRRFEISKRTKQQIIEAMKEDLESLRQ